MTRPAADRSPDRRAPARPQAPRAAPRRADGGGLPGWAFLPAALGVLLLAVPVAGVLLEVPWARFPALVASEASVDALALSLRTSLAATGLCVLLGVPLALVLARARWPGMRVVRTVVLLPLVLPPVVSGLALLTTLGRRGLLGGRLEALGVEVAFSTGAVVLAQAFVSLPFLVLALEGAARTAGTRYERVAATLGARPTTVLRRVTLPLLLPALGSGTALAFARSLGEFGATLTFAGSLQGVTRTLPLEIYLRRETDPDAALALSVVLIAVAAVIVLVTERPARRGAGEGRGDDGAGTVSAPDGPARAGAPDGAVPGSAPEEAAPATRPRGGAPSAGPALSVRAAVPDRGVDLAVEVPAGQVLAVLGPNGAGKSTLLAVAAGLVRPTGAVRVGGRTVADGATWVPPHARRVSLLAQEPLLFPHLDVTANVAFGPRAAGTPPARAEAAARERLAQVGCAPLARRRPSQLSGGQAQRVALARALATDPDVMLLDEPLSALDVGAAAEMRLVLRRVLRGSGRTALLVTHDLLDVLGIADAVVVLDGGRVVERGPVVEVLTRPRSAFAAALAGVNLVVGSLAPDRSAVVAPSPAGGAPLVLHGLPDAGCEPGGAVAATFSPRAVAVHLAPPGGSPRNVLPATVASLESQGELVRVRAATTTGHLLAADITPGSAAALGLGPGAPVHLSVKAAEVTVFPS
ncbi:ABC transporter permease [Georgenia sp. AZ-5]|uniref:ABC transporter permease n=1 Tax=Georgenia sp. AZ-5 TaxID=3367526 RepID=UPI003754A2D5